MREVHAVWLAVAFATAACQGPASAVSLAVVFENRTSEPAQVGWNIGASADPSTMQFYSVAACGDFRFSFREDTSYSVVVRYLGGSQTFSLTAPRTAGTTDEVVLIGNSGVVIDARPTPSTPDDCRAGSAKP